MRKIVYYDYGDPATVLTVIDAPRPEMPGEGQVLIDVTVLPIHNGNLLAIRGGHDPVKHKLPDQGFTPGTEGVGLIAAVGPGVDPSLGLDVGERVAFLSRECWQEQVLVSADFVTPAPLELDDHVASQLFVNPIAALLLARAAGDAGKNRSGVLRLSAMKAITENLDSKKNEPGVVLLSAAGSTVAKLAATLLGDQGIVPLGLVRSRDTAAALEEATGTPAIATDDPDWADQVRAKVNGRSLFAVLDAVGGDIGNELLALLSPGGTFVSYGSLSRDPLSVDHVRTCMEGKVIRGVGMTHWTQLPYATRRAEMDLLVDIVRRNSKLMPVEAEFPLENVPEAVRAFSRPGRRGTIFLRP